MKISKFMMILPTAFQLAISITSCDVLLALLGEKVSAATTEIVSDCGLITLVLLAHARLPIICPGLISEGERGLRWERIFMLPLTAEKLRFLGRSTFVILNIK